MGTPPFDEVSLTPAYGVTSKIEWPRERPLLNATVDRRAAKARHFFNLCAAKISVGVHGWLLGTSLARHVRSRDFPRVPAVVAAASTTGGEPSCCKGRGYNREIDGDWRAVGRIFRAQMGR